METKRNAVLITIMIVLLSAALVLLIVLALLRRDGETSGNPDAGMRNETLEDETKAANDGLEDTDKAEGGKNPENRKIDFDDLKSINPDICAWLYIPGTETDCAVVCDNDEPDYYILNEIKAPAGVFMQSYNSKAFSDRMTVIYDKKNEQGESGLDKLFRFQDSDFYKDNKYIYIYTESGVNRYRIFAAHRAAANHLMLGYDWSVDDIFLSYVSEVLSSSGISDNVDSDTVITKGDKIITLSMHVSDDENVRFLVQGVLEK